jgi:hypothetical protein
MDFDISKVENMIHRLVPKTLSGLFKLPRWNRFCQSIFLSKVIFLEGVQGANRQFYIYSKLLRDVTFYDLQ